MKTRRCHHIYICSYQLGVAEERRLCVNKSSVWDMILLVSRIWHDLGCCTEAVLTCGCNSNPIGKMCCCRRGPFWCNPSCIRTCTCMVLSEPPDTCAACAPVLVLQEHNWTSRVSNLLSLSGLRVGALEISVKAAISQNKQLPVVSGLPNLADRS